MAGEFVVDASVVAKLYFPEDDSDLVEIVLGGGDRIIAPDFLFVEMASIAAKKVRRGLATMESAVRSVNSLTLFVDEWVASSGMAERAFDLAATHGFSAYDGTYLALAEARGFELLTADIKLVRLARGAGFGALLRPLSPMD